MPTQDGGRASA